MFRTCGNTTSSWEEEEGGGGVLYTGVSPQLFSAAIPAPPSGERGKLELRLSDR